ncbi:MAG: hypothetical protein EHM43_05915 [Ignavibacteriae bacterium]|nr:MAG: hypothetical protein EHM43_05915 [Ignavibacteriota bacterium]
MRTNATFVFALMLLMSAVQLQAQLRWDVLGRMSTPRTRFQACVTEEARVIAVGGRTKGNETTATTEIIDAETGAITPGPTMSVARSEFALVKMSDSSIVAIGGYTFGYESNTDAVEVLDPNLQRWQLVGRLREARGQLAAIALDDTRILVVGGRIGNPNVRATCEIFDIANGSSALVQDFPYPTSHCQLIRNRNGEILAFSGRSGGPGSFRSDIIHRFNEGSKTWEKAGFVADSLFNPTIAALDDGGALWTGGSFRESNETDDFRSTIGRLEGSSFRKIGDMLEPRVWHSCTQINDTLCVATGGMNNTKTPYRTTELINIKTGNAATGPQMQTEHGNHSAVGLMVNNTRTMIVIGGYDVAGETDIVEILRDDCLMGAGIGMLDPGKLNMVGTATTYLNGVRMTQALPSQAGAIWIKDRQDVGNGFVSTFAFRVSKGDDGSQPDGGPVGADGFALVFQNESASGVGNVGRGIGYDGLPHGLAIEIDTYLNAINNDPSGSHVAVQVGDGTRLSSNHISPYVRSVVYDRVPPLIADGSIYNVKAEYRGGLLRVWVEADESFDDPVLELPIDIGREIGLGSDQKAWVGLTSATGLAFQQHEVIDWTFGECNAILTSVGQDSRPDGAKTIMAYPVPASELITIDLGDVAHGVTLDLHGLDGRSVRRILVDEGVTQATIAIGDVPAGLYVLRVIKRDSVAVLKVPIVR